MALLKTLASGAGLSQFCLIGASIHHGIWYVRAEEVVNRPKRLSSCALVHILSPRVFHHAEVASVATASHVPSHVCGAVVVYHHIRVSRVSFL